MSARFSVFPQDRSDRWILVPGVASTRQIEIRNESDASVECHVRVDQPAAASASPAVLTVQPRHTRTADIIFLANWSPDQDRSVVVSLRDPQGEMLATFSQEIVAAESSDCSLRLDYKEEILLDGALAGMKLWFSVTSRSATPRRFEVDFAPHPALRFPDCKTVTLAPGETTAFEVPVEWNRASRDPQGWNHPRAIEVFAPVSQGRRTAALGWNIIEKRLEHYLGPGDREARSEPAPPGERNASLEKAPGHLKYTELLELKKLEQSVVGAAPARAVVHQQLEQQPSARARKRFPVAPVASIGLAVLALLVAAFFYARPPDTPTGTQPVHLNPPAMDAPLAAAARVKPARVKAQGPVAKPIWTTVTEASHTAVAAVDASKEQPLAQPAAAPAPRTVALAPKHNPAYQTPVNRDAVVALGGLDAAYASGGRAVSVQWAPTAQASAVVQLLDVRGKIIASRTVRGQRSQMTVGLPRGYRGSVFVQVIAFGYHGERVVQSASLASGS